MTTSYSPTSAQPTSASDQENPPTCASCCGPNANDGSKTATLIPVKWRNKTGLKVLHPDLFSVNDYDGGRVYFLVLSEGRLLWVESTELEHEGAAE